MKKFMSLVLALCLICLSASVLAEAAAIPQTYDELPPAVVAEDVSEFFGTWVAQYAAYDGEVLSLEEAASSFGGRIPLFVIDAETVSATVTENRNYVHKYTCRFCGYHYENETRLEGVNWLRKIKDAIQHDERVD